MAYNGVLKAAIEDRGLSQDSAAARVGISGSLLTMILKGNALPTPKVRAKLAELLKKPEAELFTEV
jgi:transcriptional regulator with XRE-family HTH domain